MLPLNKGKGNLINKNRQTEEKEYVVKQRFFSKENPITASQNITPRVRDAISRDSDIFSNRTSSNESTTIRRVSNISKTNLKGVLSFPDDPSGIPENT